MRGSARFQFESNLYKIGVFLNYSLGYIFGPIKKLIWQLCQNYGNSNGEDTVNFSFQLSEALELMKFDVAKLVVTHYRDLLGVELGSKYLVEGQMEWSLASEMLEWGRKLMALSPYFPVKKLYNDELHWCVVCTLIVQHFYC